jgi:hypothetical protein
MSSPARTSTAAAPAEKQPAASPEAGAHAAAGARGPALAAQRRRIEAAFGPAVQLAEEPPAPNRTGMPDALKAGIESLSGMDMSAVRVHRDSPQPRQLNALAFAQGNDIHLGPGQEKHLPHEAWHIVQQRQGRVQPTLDVGGVPVNDNAGLEKEADAMGASALSSATQRRALGAPAPKAAPGAAQLRVAQLSPATDKLDAGDAIMNKTTGYQDHVTNAVNGYTLKIRQLDDTGDSTYEQHAFRMASGYKTWTENYYNKTQAYLYEAQKAGQHTNVTGHGNQNRFAMLGEDTDLEPDLAVSVEQFGPGQGGVPQVQSRTNEAVEIKASTSPEYASVDKLAGAGMKQLHKRELTGNFQSLRLELHNDSEVNHWPITDHAFANTYYGNFQNISRGAMNQRLNERMASLAVNEGIALPVHVTAEHGGNVYGSTRIN